jgi:hypothetical protein
MMGLDPVTARAGLRTAREVLSGRQSNYPVPYVLVILFVLCVACLLVAMWRTIRFKLLPLLLDALPSLSVRLFW